MIDSQLRQQGWTIPPLVTLSLAVLSISAAPIFIRVSEANIGVNATVYDRLFIFAFIFGLGRLWQRIQSPTQYADPTPVITDSRYHWILLGSVGFITVISMVLWAMSLEYTTVAKSMLLNNLTPVFTTLGGWILFGKQFDRRFLLGMTIALVGAVLLGFEDWSGSGDNLLGDILAILSSVFLGAYILIAEQLRTQAAATTILLWRCSVGSLILLPVVLLTEEQLFPSDPSAWLAVIGLGLICEGTGQRLIASCMGQFSSSFVSLFLLLEPILSSILAWIIFFERLSPLCLTGFGIVLSGIYLANTSPTCLQQDGSKSIAAAESLPTKAQTVVAATYPETFKPISREPVQKLENCPDVELDPPQPPLVRGA